MAEPVESRTSERELEQFFALAPELLCIAGGDGHFRRVNPAFAVLGYTEEELMRHPYLHFVHSGDVAQTRAVMAEVLAGRKVTSLENRYRCKNGEYRCLLWTLSVGADRTIYATARDVTMERRAEERLRMVAARLVRSNQELEEFAMVASHDLQEPLRKIRMFSDRLREEFHATLGSQGNDYLTRMESAATRGQALINGLLSYAHVTTRGQRPGDVDCGAVARQVVADLEAEISLAGGQVEILDLPVLEADPLQIRQLLQNLLTNALKFHRSGTPPVVTIRAAARPLDREASAVMGPREWWEISVSDNGIGFEAQYAERIFRLFHRLNGRSSFEGSGLGLAICKRIVERHGGTIRATSSPGLGSTFTATLPRHAWLTEDSDARLESH
jgi:PAS domain S-box-containing protein